MEETKCSNQEIQGYASSYYITLLSGEIIEMPCLKSEDISETRDGNTFICLESATYIDRLYQAFKNKELVQYIRKESIHKVITNGEEVNREFSFNHYFKISEFATSLDNDCPATYNITFETV